jgi:hypothetical protein
VFVRNVKLVAEAKAQYPLAMRAVDAAMLSPSGHEISGIAPLNGTGERVLNGQGDRALHGR